MSSESPNDDVVVRINLAMPHDIRSWSYGEVKRPEFLDPRTGRPARQGLFCDRIFGPVNDWECGCGNYRGEEHEGTVCGSCDVKVASSRVRRSRMAHVELAAPVVHPWYFRRTSILARVLDMKPESVEKVIYFVDRVVVDPGWPGQTRLKRGQLLHDQDYLRA